MADGPPADRSITVGRDANNSVITSGDGNTVIVYQTIAAVATPLAGGKNPYLGLLAFTEADADRFFGREALVGVLWESFRKVVTAPPEAGLARFLAILGPSGSGKSSLARAGLLAELARKPIGARRQRVAVMTPGAKPLDALAAVLARVATYDAAPVRKTRSLRTVLQRSAQGANDGLRRIAESLGAQDEPLVILIDQFEEIYSLCQDAKEREAFVAILLEAACDRGGAVSIIVTMRSDFLGATQADSALNQAIAAQNLIVPAMSADELRRAIAQPAINAGHPLDENTIQRLMSETAGRDGALPLLQFVLVRVWDGMINGVTAAKTVEDLGGVGGALGAEAERIYGELTPPQQVIAQRAFLAMVQFNDNQQPTRHRAFMSQLAADDEGLSDEQELALVRPVIDRFAQPDARLITLAATADGDQTVEVSHEAIFTHWKSLSDWLADGMDDIRLHLRVADAADHWDKGGRVGSLWTPPDLDLLRDFAAKPTAGLTATERAFFKASDDAVAKEIADKKRRDRLFRIAAVVFLVLFLGAGGLGWMALVQSSKAEIQRTNAQASAAWRAIDEGQITRGLLLALEAVPAGKESETRYRDGVAALKAAVLNLKEQRALDGGGGEFAAGGRRVVTSSAKAVRIWDADTGRLIPGVAAKGEWQANPLSPFVLVSSGTSAVILDARDGRTMSRLDGDWKSTLSPDGGKVISLGPAGGLIWDAASGQLLVALPEVTRAAISRDGQRIAAFDGRTVRLLDGAGRGLAALGASEAPLSIEFSRDGRRLMVVAQHGISLWNATDGVRVPVAPPAAGATLEYAAFSDAGERILARTRTARGYQVVVVEAETGKTLPVIDEVSDATISPHGKLVAVTTGVHDETWLYNATTGRRQRQAPTRANTFARFTFSYFSPEGDRILLISPQGGQVYDIPDLTPSGPPLKSDEATFRQARFSPDGRRVVTASDDSTSRIWDVSPPGGQPPLDFDRQVGVRDISRDGRLAFKRGEDGRVSVWDAVTRRHVTTLEAALPPEARLFISGAGRTLVSGSATEIQFWDLQTGRRQGPPLKGLGANPQLLGISRDGQQVAVGDSSGAVRVWRRGESQPVGPPLRDFGEVDAAAFSLDGRRIVMAGRANGIRVWNIGSGKIVGHAFPGSNQFVFDLDWSRDGSLIVTGSGDGPRIWDATTGRLIGKLNTSEGAEFVGFSPDGSLVVNSSAGRAAQLWDAQTRRLLATYEFEADGGVFGRPAFTPDGRGILVPRVDGLVMWAPRVLDGAALRAEACRRRPRQLTDEERRAYGLGGATDPCATGPRWLRALGLGR